jgi:hypothetical protein
MTCRHAGPWHGVTPLDVAPVARLVRAQRGGHHPAAVAVCGEIVVEPLPTRPRFIATAQRGAFGRQLPDERVESALARADGAEGADRGVVVLSHEGDREGRLRDIHATVERARRRHG